MTSLLNALHMEASESSSATSMRKEEETYIFPVILKVPDEKKRLSGRDSVQFLSYYAREAVIASAKTTGMDITDLENGSNGAPMPSNGFFWSLSHKPEYVAGVASGHWAGIDLEPIRPVSPSLVDRIMDDREKQLAGMTSDEIFFRFWTAKEAVLKTSGAGLRELSKCRIHRVVDAMNLVVSYRQRQWQVETVCYDNHLVSVVKNDKTVRWLLPIGDNEYQCKSDSKFF